MKLGEFLERYVFVRICVGCGERMGYEYKDEAFCDACRISWERAKNMSCTECFASMSECRCMPKPMADAGVTEFRKLTAYIAHNDSHPENKLLYFLKHNKNKRAATFAANQLIYKIDELISENELNRDDVVITYIPRSRRAYAREGVDQARLICKMISEVSGIECLPLIKRKKDGKSEQKALARSKRLANARGMFELDEKLASECRGRAVIIFDDIVTSGASMAANAKLICRGGIERVYALSVAYSLKEKSGANFIFR